jgi:hypothetical protein
MVDEDLDRAEIDLLVRQLAAGPRRPPTPAAPAGYVPVRPEPGSGAAQAADVSQAPRRPGRRWSNVRLLMPSRRTPASSAAVVRSSGISLPLPQLPDLGGVLRTPRPSTVARLWVGLSVLYGAAMTFWPYSKTYLWGMEMYLFALGLVLVAGVWGARLSWDARLGGAHTTSLCTVAWAVLLAASEALPAI